MQETIVLPYMRNSATRLPRRDIVITAGDSLTLRASIVESDDPAARALVLTGGVGGPQARIVVFTDSPCPGYGWDYGRPVAAPGTVLWVGYGVRSETALGSFDFFVPFETIGTLPGRCAWALQLAWDAGRKSEMLARGIMHVSGPMQDSGQLTVWTTDDDQPITTDDDENIYA
jgi:hypothetical protein